MMLLKNATCPTRTRTESLNFKFFASGEHLSYAHADGMWNLWRFYTKRKLNKQTNS
jgi:hypothetical protein